MSTSHLGNLVTVGECKSEFQNTSGTAERLDRADCSTSYAIADWHSEPDEMMSLAITSPGHSGLGPCGYPEIPNNITSVISESEYWKEIMQFFSSDTIQLVDGEYANNTCATQFHELQHGEMTQNQFTQFMVSENVTNANEHCQINNVLMVPEASTTRKVKSEKSWTKICSILKWLALKRFVKLKKVRMTKKRKLSST